MGIDVERLAPDDADRWDSLVERSSQSSPFHLSGCLSALADHSGGRLHRLIGYKGQEPVGLFPVFELSKGPFGGAFSPPPDLKVPYLGPILVNHGKLKQRKAERRHRRFIEGCLDYIEGQIGSRYTQVRSTDRYGDTRPFYWNDFEVTPLYSYVVDLTRGADDLLAAFSRDARQNITGEYDGYEISEGDADDAARILRDVKARHDEQREPYKVTPALGRTLYRSLPEGTVRPYVCRIDGEYRSGMLALELGDTVYRWQGGAKTDADIPINDLVDWRIMTDAIDRGIDRYDLVGAWTPRLCEYKAKFAPDLVTYSEIRKTGLGMDAAAKAYMYLR